MGDRSFTITMLTQIRLKKRLRLIDILPDAIKDTVLFGLNAINSGFCGTFIYILI
jgi:hypothetical protein